MLSKKSLVLCMCALFAFTAPAMAAPSKILRVGMGDPIDSEMGAIAKRFKEIVEQRTNGDMEVQIFPSGQLGGETEMIQNVRSGSLDVAVVGIANTVPFVKKLGVLTLPYLFDNIYEVVRGTTGEGFEILNNYAMKEGGFQVLGYTYTDYRWLSNDIRPIKNIQDVKGLKFRVPQSAVLLETYKSWGANPVPISWPETFTALQQGVVDGQCYGYITFQAFKFNEVQKYVTEVHYTYQLQPMIVSMRVMKGLTPEQRDIVTQAGKDAQEFCLAFQLTESTRVKKELIASGTQIDTLEDEAEWKKLAQEHVWPKMMDFVGGKERVDAYLEAIGKK